MAISRERLEELIEQGATIYEAKYGNINPVSLINKIRFIYDDCITFEPSTTDKYNHHKYSNRLFETRGEAEWFLKFENVTRVDNLNLPTFKEMMRREHFSFMPKMYAYPMVIRFDKDRDIIWMENKYALYYNWCGINEENYDRACEEAKRLFLGADYERE